MLIWINNSQFIIRDKYRRWFKYENTYAFPKLIGIKGPF